MILDLKKKKKKTQTFRNRGFLYVASQHLEENQNGALVYKLMINSGVDLRAWENLHLVPQNPPHLLRGELRTCWGGELRTCCGGSSASR